MVKQIYKIPKKEEIELVKAIYEQHWLHIRQVGNERLWIANIFSIVAAYILSTFRSDLYGRENWPVIVFIMFLSIFGVLYSLKIDSLLKTHQRYANKIVDDYQISHWRETYEKNWINNHIKISRLFPIYFALYFLFFLGILIYAFFETICWSISIPLLILIITVFFLYGLDYDRFENKE